MFVGLESSTDLRNRRNVTNATLIEESITFLHTNSASQQFYRALPLRLASANAYFCLLIGPTQVVTMSTSSYHFLLGRSLLLLMGFNESTGVVALDSGKLTRCQIQNPIQRRDPAI